MAAVLFSRRVQRSWKAVVLMNEAPLSELSDSLLVVRAKGGDAEAYGQLYRRYVDPIYRYLSVRLGNTQDAEDLTENVFLQSFRALDRYRDRGRPFSVFLYRVAKNALIDRFRQRKANVPLSAGAPIFNTLSTLDEHGFQDEQAKKLRRTIDELPSHYREVIILRAILALPTTEVARWINQTEGATRVLFHRALAALREMARE
jgi:RNA polymerase sigma-70 factor (ECF subfamily)